MIVVPLFHDSWLEVHKKIAHRVRSLAHLFTWDTLFPMEVCVSFICLLQSTLKEDVTRAERNLIKRIWLSGLCAGLNTIGVVCERRYLGLFDHTLLSASPSAGGNGFFFLFDVFSWHVRRLEFVGSFAHLVFMIRNT